MFLMRNTHGLFRDWQVDRFEVEPTTSRVSCAVRLEFEDGFEIVNLEFVVDAFSALLTAIEAKGK